MRGAILGAPGDICFTTDLWTSPQTLSFMCITAQLVDPRWGQQNCILDFVHMSEYHTSENLAQLFFSIVHEEWGLTGRVFSITCDNASNNDGAIRLIAARDPLFTEENHFRSFAHVVNLVVQQLLKYGEEELC